MSDPLQIGRICVRYFLAFQFVALFFFLTSWIRTFVIDVMSCWPVTIALLETWSLFQVPGKLWYGGNHMFVVILLYTNWMHYGKLQLNRGCVFNSLLAGCIQLFPVICLELSQEPEYYNTCSILHYRITLWQIQYFFFFPYHDIFWKMPSLNRGRAKKHLARTAITLSTSLFKLFCLSNL